MELDTVGSLGEFGIISRITKGLPAAPAVSVGPGDDAAVFLVNGSSVTSVDLGHIADSSQVCIDLDSARFDVPVPLHAVAAATGTDPLRFILTGGEDHALVATFPLGDVPPDWQVIGVVSDAEPGVLVDGQPYDQAQGWDHFRH